MKTLGCDKLATGHYARVAEEQFANGSSRWVLLEGVDQQKDQSYYLYGLTQEQLSQVMFPLGSMHKQEIYELAKRYNVPYDETSYRESQDLCFFPEKTPQPFLKRHLEDSLQSGNIVKRDGTVVGTHQGLPLYTQGQRRIGVGGLQIPLEVVAKNTAANELIVADQGAEPCNAVTLADIRWVSWQPSQNEVIDFECRTHSHGKRVHGQLKWNGSKGSFRFHKPQAPQAPGQSLVFYRGEEVVGGGVMNE